MTLGVGSNLGFRQGYSHCGVQQLMQAECTAALAKARLKLNWRLIDTTGDNLTAPPKNPGSALAGLRPADTLAALNGQYQLARINRQLATRVRRLVKARQTFLVLGGDHAIAMGTWSGAIEACSEDNAGKAKSFGLLWIDAHLDAHNYCSSPSKNIHGMPLRALLDNSDHRLQRLCPQSGELAGHHLQLLGIRSYEPSEQTFMERQHATITYMRELPAGDCGPALLQALSTLSKRCSMIGISLDVDAIDPLHAPGVGTREALGIRLQSLCKALTQARHFDKVVGLEICEYDPSKDIRHRTRAALVQLISAFYG